MELSDSSEFGMKEDTIRFKEDQYHLFDFSSVAGQSVDFPFAAEPEQLQWCFTSKSESEPLPEERTEYPGEKVPLNQVAELTFTSNDHLINESVGETEVAFVIDGEIHSYFLVQDSDVDVLKNKTSAADIDLLEFKEDHFRQTEASNLEPFLLDQNSSLKHLELETSEAHVARQSDLPETEEEFDTSRLCPQCDRDLSNEDYFEHLKTNHSGIGLHCPQCPLTFATPDLLNAHYKYDHYVRTPTPHRSRVPSRTATRFDCSVCQKTYGSQREFSNHKRRKDFCKPPLVEEVPSKRRIGIIRRSL